MSTAITRHIVLSLIFVLCAAGAAFAAPHIDRSIPDPVEHTGRTLQERQAASLLMGKMTAAPLSFATPTTVTVLFLRVEFQPEANPTAAKVTGSGLWNDTLYRFNNDPDYWVTHAQVRFIDYWKEVSYGLLTVSIDISSKIYQLPQVMTAYSGSTAASIESIIYDSITTAATDTALDFTRYDGVFIVHAGAGQETDISRTHTNDLWSLYYSSSGAICRNASISPCVSTTLRSGQLLNEAIIMPQTETRPGLTVDPLGVYVHEFGHWLGLPDLYCTTSSGCPREGVGNWSLMDEGSYNADNSGIRGSSPAHLDAWSRYRLGWIAPVVLDPTQADPAGTLSLGAVETVPPPTVPVAGTSVYKVQASTSTAKQYFLLENRQKNGFDAGIPGHGLLVWLINEDVIDANIGSNAVNSASFPGVKLIEADGNMALQKVGAKDFGSAGDPFPGSKINPSLTPLTEPSSIPYTNFGWINIRNIAESGSVVTFSLGYGPHPPANFSVNTATKTLSWDANSASVDPDLGSYTVYKNSIANAVASIALQPAPKYTDGSFTTSDVYLVTAVDVHGNESQPALIAPVITVNPASLAFTDTHYTDTVTISNSGNADLKIMSVSLAGNNPSEFSISHACATALSPGATCIITVTFTPRTTGTKSAFLAIETNDPANTILNIELSGSLTRSSQSGGYSNGGGTRTPCFIATAAYGSAFDKHVEILRKFRDDSLMTNAVGRSFVEFYYVYSPPVADFISKHYWARAVVRALLFPVIMMVQYRAIMLYTFPFLLLFGVMRLRMKKWRSIYVDVG